MAQCLRFPRLVLSLHTKVVPERRLVDLGPLPPCRLIQDDEASRGAVEDAASGRGHQHGVAERDAAPADFEVGNFDAEYFAGLERRGLAGVELRALIRLEPDRVA